MEICPYKKSEGAHKNVCALMVILVRAAVRIGREPAPPGICGVRFGQRWAAAIGRVGPLAVIAFDGRPAAAEADRGSPQDFTASVDDLHIVGDLPEGRVDDELVGFHGVGHVGFAFQRGQGGGSECMSVGIQELYLDIFVHRCVEGESEGAA